MKGLLIKDFYSIVSQLKLFLIIIIAFALVPGYSVSAVRLLFAVSRSSVAEIYPKVLDAVK